MLKSKKILFLLSGSISCYKVCSVISELVKDGHNVQAVITKSASQFIGNATLEGLTHRPVYSDCFEHSKMMAHIDLMKNSDLIICAPATANIINKFSQGIGDDLVSSLFLAYDFKRPFLIAPAMNSNMYHHPATQRSLLQLKEWGIQIIAPEEGELACGDVGVGRLAAPEVIAEKIKMTLGGESEQS
jgi:phosphopantothenoylcysteine decarboxylase/phosphopantothenate--cysteine ligase